MPRSGAVTALEQLADLPAGVERRPQRPVRVRAVDVAAPDPGPVEVAGVAQFGDDALRGAFGDPDGGGDVTQADRRVRRRCTRARAHGWSRTSRCGRVRPRGSRCDLQGHPAPSRPVVRNRNPGARETERTSRVNDPRRARR